MKLSEALLCLVSIVLGGCSSSEKTTLTYPDRGDGLIADRDRDGAAAADSLDLAEYRFLGESPEDYAGYWVATAGDVDGDDLDDVLIGAYDETGESGGAAYLILGKSLGARGTRSLSRADHKFVGERAGDWAGFVVSHGNLDGDGLDDIVIGAYGCGDKGPITGAVYVVLGRSLGEGGTFSLSKADYKLVGEGEDDYAGYALTSEGDVDGDGLDDLLIGASGQDAAGTNAGAGYLVLSSSLGSERTLDLADADYKFTGEADDSWAGYSISYAGDVDGDGLDDLLLGADADDGGTESHVAYLILGSSLGSRRTVPLAEADYKLVGETSYDYASQVSGAGDVDGDGLDDIVIGAAGRDDHGYDSGGAYVVLGKSLGVPRTLDLSNADYRLLGEDAYDYAGSTVSDAGDVDGDGLGDILVGALKYDGRFDYQGAAYLVLGSSLGERRTLELSQACRMVGRFEGDHAGAAVSCAGDVDGDGLDDVVLGSYGGPDGNGAASIITARAMAHMGSIDVIRKNSNDTGRLPQEGQRAPL